MDFRYEFKKDVVVDMYCYRRQGHNESDEPAFTQPLLYKAIRERKSVREGYLEHLLKLGEVTRDEADAIAQEQRDKLDAQLTQAKKHKEPELPRHRPSILGRIWKQYRGGMDSDVPDANTGVARDQLVELLNGLNALPEGFTHHPRLKRFFKARAAMAAGEQPLDWATGEALAFATLAVEGAPVRLCGQDSARGTFSQRHAVFYDYETGEGYMPLDNLTEDQAPVRVVNSPLSEAGVLGYEYGYSLAYPDALVMWEAQFGDFVNAAQVLIDQGITSAEDKWGSLSGLVMLLPHGFEGMGPEHSSARLERFLTLAAEDNIQVANPSTPAQYFHLLRRQVVRPYRKPLVVMTPKSMLRMPEASSNLDELAQGRFQRMLPDPKGVTGAVDRVLLCSGKVYYDLVEAREERERDDVAILRAEQLYPLQESYLDEALSPYPEGTPVMWVQEEPENMGAWQHVHGRFCGGGVVGKWPLHGAYRPANASTATGSASSHRLEQQRLIEDAFRPLD
jgi:2-oxoglutarate dehydrogenase E1 component